MQQQLIQMQAQIEAERSEREFYQAMHELDEMLRELED